MRQNLSYQVLVLSIFLDGLVGLLKEEHAFSSRRDCPHERYSVAAAAAKALAKKRQGPDQSADVQLDDFSPELRLNQTFNYPDFSWCVFVYLCLCVCAERQLISRGGYGMFRKNVFSARFFQNFSG